MQDEKGMDFLSIMHKMLTKLNIVDLRTFCIFSDTDRLLSSPITYSKKQVIDYKHF